MCRTCLSFSSPSYHSLSSCWLQSLRRASSVRFININYNFNSLAGASFGQQSQLSGESSWLLLAPKRADCRMSMSMCGRRYFVPCQSHLSLSSRPISCPDSARRQGRNGSSDWQQVSRLAVSLSRFLFASNSDCNCFCSLCWPLLWPVSLAAKWTCGNCLPVS